MWEAIQKIIVATDFSELSEAAVRSAAVFALPDDASVHLLHVIRFPFADTNYRVHIPEAIQEDIRKKTRERMYESMLMLEEAGVSEVDLIVSESRQPSNAIAESVRELDADLVIMATHGRRGLKHAFLGSITERTVRTSLMPVLAIKGNGMSTTPLLFFRVPKA